MTDPGNHSCLREQVEAMRKERRRLAMGVFEGKRAWIRLALPKRLRIQMTKGPPRWLLAREARLLRAMGARGAPVPPVLAAGRDYLVLGDCGLGLDKLLDERPEPSHEAALMGQVGHDLARFHAFGCTHGRPYIRDILVSAEGTIAFTDLERGARIDAPRAFQVRDLGFLVLSIYARWPDRRGHRLVDSLLHGYFAAAPPDMPTLVAGWCRRLRWLAILGAPLRWRETRWKSHKRWREHAALPLMLERLSACSVGARSQAYSGDPRQSCSPQPRSLHSRGDDRRRA